MDSQAGVGRTRLTPYWGVELTGWGYYLRRTWQDVRDHLHATALVVESGGTQVAVISLDLMIISREFTHDVRQRVTEATGIPGDHVLVCCTHTHNAPASGGLLGVGEVDQFYEQWAARQAATAAIRAWADRSPAALSSGVATMGDLTFNRTRKDGPVDSQLTVLRTDRLDGTPLCVVVGFQGHPTVSTVLQPRSVSRDVPGQVCDHLERALPGCTAMYLQGACGDVNFHRSFSTPEASQEPARRLAAETLQSLKRAEPLDVSQLRAASKSVRLPTRRWMQSEIDVDRNEAERRLRDRDLTGWRESIGRVMTNRPDDMVARHGGDEWNAVAAMCRFNLEWTDRILLDLESRPEWLETEVQAMRIGDFGLVSNSSEFFTTLALDVRARAPFRHLMLACYANGRIGYLPDAHDVENKTYASYQSPKYCNQFPFTEASGAVMVEAMTDLLKSL